MGITAHVYQVYIAADAARVWQAITDSEWTRQYFHSTQFVAPPEAGQPYRTVMPDGSGAVDGMVEELTPPDGERPGRFVQTWHVLYDAAMACAGAGAVGRSTQKIEPPLGGQSTPARP